MLSTVYNYLLMEKINKKVSHTQKTENAKRALEVYLHDSFNWDSEVIYAEVIYPYSVVDNDKSRADLLIELKTNYLYLRFVDEKCDSELHYNICLTADKNISAADIKELLSDSGSCSNSIYTTNNCDFEMNPKYFNDAFYNNDNKFAKNIVYSIVYRDSDYHSLNAEGKLIKNKRNN